ncbi:FAD-dependent oxidoreductase [Microbacterium sp. NPDC096154]|uniref:FAD-dependent oxidoreductase n=1 Tax=Microbacterium sp. NPDC096154 TaxID=3155549 RepID=UPI00331C73A8
MPPTSIVVIGAGLAGAATAWQLARRGHDVVVLERTYPANPWGSSHGSARIFRYAYPDELYTRLVVAARSGWDELERDAGERLISDAGAVDHGALRDPAGLARVLEKAGVPHELLAADGASARWDGIAFDGPVLWHADAGVLDAERAVQAMLRRAQDAGAVVRHDWPVASVSRSGAGYRVVSEHGEAVEAAQVVVAAGGWLPDLLGALGVGADALRAFPALEVRQEQAFHFPYRDGADAWPTVIHKTAPIQIYALPGGRDAGFRGQKVAEYNGGPVIRSAAAHDRRIDETRRERVIAYVRANLPGLVPEPYAETTCLFTNTPDEDFVIDRIEGITILSPCSGHGAKFAPLLGEFAARLVEGDGGVPERFRPLTGVPAGAAA